MCGRELPIPRQEGHVVTAGLLKPCTIDPSQASIGIMPDDPHSVHRMFKSKTYFQRRIGTPVVDDDDFVWSAERCQLRRDLGDNAGQVERLIVGRNNDRD
jgi:hypothetical protein